MRRFALTLLAVALCAPAAWAAEHTTLKLATTTSTDNSGLLKQLLPPFEEQTGITVQVIAVGTGKALRMGRDGDVDVVLVHAPALEEQFVADGAGVNRRAVMYNDFVVVGPPRDPAGIAGESDASAAFERIASGEHLFVSRGDESGTHQKEKALWGAAAVAPEGSWYREAGQGMGRVLQMANELDAYTLSDRGTWLAMKSKLPNLAVTVEGDSRLHNPYGVIAVNPATYSDVAYRAAMRLIAWLTSVEGQKLIGAYRVGGEVLFHPTAVPGT